MVTVTRPRSVLLCSIVSLVSVFVTTAHASTQCQSQKGTPIDWFIAYKMPKAEHELPTNSFYYMDAKQPTWTLSEKTIDQKGQSVFYTLDQIYASSFNKTGTQMFGMYNDNPGLDALRWRANSFGHTKGVFSFDETTGFWLIHSTPQFPPLRSEGYEWPDSAEKFGQTFLCISLNTEKNMNVVGKQLQYNHPNIYDSGMSDAMSTRYPEMADALIHKHPTDPPYYHQAELTSLAGVSFQSFAKYSLFDADMYSTWVAPVLKADLMVETWQNGINPLCTNCSGKYHVYNINKVNLGPSDFKETGDHAKWAVTNSTSNRWTCIGDINRQKSQEHRPGGTVCFQNSDVWSQFHKIIGGYDKCGESSHSSCVK